MIMPNRINSLAASVFIGCTALFPADSLLGETYVTTYITKVQEERQSTRWTLTEWLRIKERMKLMDVWLAMFSDPKKDAFRPELSLAGGPFSGAISVDGVKAGDTFSGAHATAQLWFTNLISGTVGIRTLNIDWGVEGGARTLQADGAVLFRGDESDAQAADDGLELTRRPLHALAAGDPGEQMRSHYTANLRIFGKNIQDSSFGLKYGKYTFKTDWSTAIGSTSTSRSFTGVTYGADMQLYLLKWLGAEGNYQVFDAAAVADEQVSGGHYFYGPYIEISLFRFMGGWYRNTWEFRDRQGLLPDSVVEENGVYYGMKIQI